MKRALVGVVAALSVAGLLVAAPTPPAAEAQMRDKLVVTPGKRIVKAYPKFNDGFPMLGKPAYPEDCGLGTLGAHQLPWPNEIERPSAAPFAGSCDVIPMEIEIPNNIRKSDDLLVEFELHWPRFAPGQGSDLDFWVWDDKQNVAGKKPVPEPDGTAVNWTPAEVLTEFTLIGTGAGNEWPQKVQLSDSKARLGRYNIVVLNRNAPGVGPQPHAGPTLQNGKPNPCIALQAPLGCYWIEAEIKISSVELPDEKTEPTVPVTPNFNPPPPPVTVPDAPPVDLTPVIGPMKPELEAVDFQASIEPPPTPKADETVVLGEVEASADPLLEAIKARPLEDELAGPELAVAATEEKPPVPPSAGMVAASALALPVLGALGLIGFLIRRRSSFRLG